MFWILEVRPFALGANIRLHLFRVLGGGGFLAAISAKNHALDNPGAEGGVPPISTLALYFNNFGFCSHKISFQTDKESARGF